MEELEGEEEGREDKFRSLSFLFSSSKLDGKRKMINGWMLDGGGWWVGWDERFDQWSKRMKGPMDGRKSGTSPSRSQDLRWMESQVGAAQRRRQGVGVDSAVWLEQAEASFSCPCVFLDRPGNGIQSVRSWGPG